jgi:hypothetical protein
MEPTHMEDLWEQAEQLSLTDHSGVQATISEISTILDKLKDKSDDVVVEFFGHLLFSMCALSNKLDINSFVALREAIEDAQEALLDP